MNHEPIRNADPQELDAIMDIYAQARRFMAAHGNPRQWGATNWPPRALIQQDIAAGKCYVYAPQGPVAGVFFYDFGPQPEPGYRDIQEGQWLSDAPYGVIHRLASDGSLRGVGRACIGWAWARAGHLRVDTHPDNRVMQNLLDSLGFRQCGIIHVQEDRDPRLAYEKLP